MSLHPQTAGQLRDAAIIFLAATVLGLAFNASSPLGIRAAPPAAAKGAAGPDPSASTPLPSRAAAGGIQNETLSITIDTSASEPQLGGKAPPTITWPEAKPLVASGSAVLVDTRDARAFEAGHIPGAISVPMNSFNERIGEFAVKYPPGKTIIVYCASSQCSISRTFAQLLIERHGYTDVRDMSGGYVEWRLAQVAGGEPVGGDILK
jgi:rhodanese-related sulfurtransferase